MEVKVAAATPDPILTASLAAGCCYGKDDESVKRLVTCLKSGHLSVFEHISATWEVKGISRACSHQLVRHRLASYSQQSQRYCKIDTVTDDWYVTPPAFKNSEVYRKAMKTTAELYSDALECGIKPEDARYLLPNSCKTDIWITMNFREFMHFLDVRGDQRAQWEIQDLAAEMAEQLGSYSREWSKLLGMYAGHSKHFLWISKIYWRDEEDG